MREKVLETQVAIIGGGIVGTAIARELSQYTIDTCLLEKEPAVGWGITKGSMSLIHGGTAHLGSRILKRTDTQSSMTLEALLSQPLDMKEKLGQTGRKMYFELAPFLNATVIQIGKIYVASDQKQLETIKLVKKMAEVQGVMGLRVLDRDGLREKEPLISTKFIGGLFDPSEAAIFAPEWATAFAENARDNGVHILLDTEVTAIKEGKGCYSIKTTQGTVKAEFVVNAAGLFADEIASMVGKPDFSMYFYKCQMLVLENKGYISHVVGKLPEPGLPKLLLPTAHGDILVVHTMEPSTNKHDLTTTKEGLDLLSTYPSDFIPDISPKNDIKSSFAGFLAFNTKNAPDYLVEFGKDRFLNVALAAPGLGPAPALAKEVVALLGDEGLELTEKSDFNPYRFTEPRFIDLTTEEKNERIARNPRYGHIICRCEHVSEQEVVEAVKCGARTLDEVKFRTRAGMGRCQGGFCTSRVLEVMARELRMFPVELTKKGNNSPILKYKTKELREGRQGVAC